MIEAGVAFAYDSLVDAPKYPKIPAKTRRSKCMLKGSVTPSYVQVTKETIMHVIKLIEQTKRSMTISMHIRCNQLPNMGLERRINSRGI